MPINIYRQTDEGNEKIAWICDDEWELPAQIETLESWLHEHASGLRADHYLADIGYSLRTGACGGGACVSIVAMQAMVAVGMELFLSEYPECVDEIP